MDRKTERETESVYAWVLRLPGEKLGENRGDRILISWMVSEIVRLISLYLDPCCKWITSKI